MIDENKKIALEIIYKILNDCKLLTRFLRNAGEHYSAFLIENSVIDILKYCISSLTYKEKNK